MFFAAAKFAVNDKAIEISQAETDYSGTAKVATNDEAEQISQTDAKNILKVANRKARSGVLYFGNVSYTWCL